MPRQKFCSVPGCISNTDSIKLEQEVYLSTFCQGCSSARPCRCPAPDIFTTRRETRNKFTAWCNAIGLTSHVGYYINVCYKHFSAGCPTRICPNPDVIAESIKFERKWNIKKQQQSPKSIKLTSPFLSKTSSTAMSLTSPTLMPPLTSATPLKVSTTSPPVTLPTVPIPKDQLREFSLILPVSPSLSDDNMSFDKLLPATKVYKVDTEHGLLLMEQFEPGSGFEMLEDFSAEAQDSNEKRLLREESDDPCLNDGFVSARSRNDSIQSWLDICEHELYDGLAES